MSSPVQYVVIQDWNPVHELIKAAFSSASAVVVLLLGWSIGKKLTYRWNVRQKCRELQLSASQQFYEAYGEFFAVWKLWNRLDRSDAGFEDRRWELHKRSAAAEAVVEGLFVKLSSELNLDKEQLDDLGCFRQAFQQLREAIRQDNHLLWPSSDNRAYKAFKSLAIRMSGLLARDWPSRPPPRDRAIEQLLTITSNSFEKDWAE
jgi:hypothetical protein